MRRASTFSGQSAWACAPWCCHAAWTLLVLAGVTLPAGRTAAEPFGPSQPVAVETRLIQDLADGACDEHSFLQAAILASGVTDRSQLSKCEEEFAAALQAWRPIVATRTGDLACVRTIHRLVHERFLQGRYRADQDNVAELLESGSHNCLSATVLLVAFCRDLGVPAMAVEAPGHVLAYLPQADSGMLIESASPTWRVYPFPSLTAVQKPGDTQRQFRVLSPTDLIASIYFNRGVHYLEQGRFADALEANKMALAIDPKCASARENLLATVNNWAVAVGTSGQVDQALEMLEAAQAIAPEFQPFAANRKYLAGLAGPK